MNNHMNTAKFYALGSYFYELAVSTNYDESDGRRLMDMIELLTDQHDDDCMIPFWEALRDYAHIDNPFCNMLIASDVLTKDEIFGLEYGVDSAIHDMQNGDLDLDDVEVVDEYDYLDDFEDDDDYQ